MKFGVIPPYGIAALETGAYAAEFARVAERSGFESIWVVEHVVMPSNYRSVYPYDPSGRSPFTAEVVQPDPLVWLGYVAAHTSTIRLATGVLILPQRNPLILAKELATLDRLSGGRVLLGVGVGWVREEAEALGTDFASRARRADEYVAVMRALWREPAASFSGEFVRFDGMVCEPKPVRPEGVPIVVGGHSSAAARRAGRWGDGFFPLGVTPERMVELRAELGRAARSASRDPERIEITTVATADGAGFAYCKALGTRRMVIAARDRDLDSLARSFDRFANDVMAKH